MAIRGSLRILSIGGVVAAAAMFGVWARGSSVPPRNRNYSAPSSCMVSTATYVTPPSTYGKFVSDAQSTMKVSPFVRFELVPTPLDKNFVIGHLQGLLNSVALRAPYKEQEDAYARSLGYKVGKLPYVPLQGQVVSDNHGLLELYQTHLVFDSPTFASQVVQRVRVSNSSTVVPVPDSFGLNGLDAVAFESTQSSSAAVQESIVGVDFADGNDVVQLNFRGGEAMSTAFVAPLVAEARRLADRCS